MGGDGFVQIELQNRNKQILVHSYSTPQVACLRFISLTILPEQVAACTSSNNNPIWNNSHLLNMSKRKKHHGVKTANQRQQDLEDNTKENSIRTINSYLDSDSVIDLPYLFLLLFTICNS